MTQTKKLHTLCHINSGGTPSRGKAEYYGGDIPWAKIGDIEKSDGTIYETEEYITESGLKNIRNRIFPKGTLLFSMYGSVGKVAFCGVELTTNQAILGIQVKNEAKDELSLEYLKYWFRANIMQLKKKAVGGILKNLSATIVKDFDIPLPSFSDQKRIAKIIADCESLIKKRKESIALLDELLKSTFLDMFGDPVKNNKGWDLVPLSKFGTIDRGVSKHRPRNAPQLLNGKHPLIQTGDVANSGTFITKHKQTYSDLGLQQSKMWPKGTLCITIAANIAKTGILNFDACFPDSIVGFIVNSQEATNLYVHNLFTFFQRILEKNAPSAAQKNINLAILRTFKVPQPPIDVQLQFDLIVNKVEIVKDQFQESLKELENLYGSLSQRAFSGKLDLSKIEITDMEEKEPTKPETEPVGEPYQVGKATLQDNIVNIDEIIRNNFSEVSFSFEQLEEAIQNTGVYVKYDAIKDFVFKSLEGESPLLEQIFEEIKGVEENSKLDSKIMLKLKS